MSVNKKKIKNALPKDIAKKIPAPYAFKEVDASLYINNPYFVEKLARVNEKLAKVVGFPPLQQLKN